MITQEYLNREQKRLTIEYPHINPREGEDLNIQRNIQRIFTSMYENTEKYPKIWEICLIMGISMSVATRMARKCSKKRNSTNNKP